MDGSKRRIGLRSLILYVVIFLLGYACSRYWEDQLTFVSREEFKYLIKESQKNETNTLSWNHELVESELQLIEHGSLMHLKSLLFNQPRRHWYVFLETEPQNAPEQKKTLRELGQRRERTVTRGGEKVSGAKNE